MHPLLSLLCYLASYICKLPSAVLKDHWPDFRRLPLQILSKTPSPHYTTWSFARRPYLRNVMGSARMSESRPPISDRSPPYELRWVLSCLLGLQFGDFGLINKSIATYLMAQRQGRHVHPLLKVLQKLNSNALRHRFHLWQNCVHIYTRVMYTKFLFPWSSHVSVDEQKLEVWWIFM